MTPQEIERINKIGHELYNHSPYFFTWSKLANKTGWSTTTVRKYYDKEWYPGKYFKEKMKIEPVSNCLGCGIYMLAQQVVENHKILNLIKVGKSKNLSSRLKDYVGMNPFAKCIDVFQCDVEDLDKLEKTYHMILGKDNRRYGNTEWFICDDKQFQYWLDNKLNYFRG